MASRIANSQGISTTYPLVSSHYPPEYHSFMYSANFSNLPKRGPVENFMFWNTAGTLCHIVMPVLLVTRTTIVDSAAIMLLGSGPSDSGGIGNSLLQGCVINYAWMKDSATSLSGGVAQPTPACAITSASWTANSTTLTVTTVGSGTITPGQTIITSSIPGATDLRNKVGPYGFGIVSQLTGTTGGTGTYKMSSAPTAAASAQTLNLYNKTSVSNISDVLYSNSAGEPYLLYGKTLPANEYNKPENGPELGTDGVPITLPGYDTGASSDLLGPSAYSDIPPPYMDFPSDGENWGASASYPIVNNVAVVDRASGGLRGVGKALAIVVSIQSGSEETMSPPQIRSRLSEIRMLVTIRHRSSLSGGKGG